MTIEEFAHALRQDIHSRAQIYEDGALLGNIFPECYREYLIDIGEIDEFEIHPYRKKNLRACGYNITYDIGMLDLFIDIYTDKTPPGIVSAADIQKAFIQLKNFLLAAFQGVHQKIPESSPGLDMAYSIHSFRSDIVKIRLFLLTDGRARSAELPEEYIEDIPVSFHVWDIDRLFKSVGSGKSHGPIEIDIKAQFGVTIPCLPIEAQSDDYKPYLAVFPGELLAKIYNEYSPGLLERNVRAFLEARGGVNRGIKDTILNYPDKFFAYNNGIAATADEVAIDFSGTTPQITKIKNLQIVNGGQTTASLHRAWFRDKAYAQVRSVHVPMKLSVVPGHLIDELVPKISRYANTQNKVSTADFSSNHPFHIELEKLSRSIWAPPKNDSQKMTRWFYERARGQYADSVGKEPTPGKRKAFKSDHPQVQKITKTDLAKYENSWGQYPYLVCLGADKNFRQYMAKLFEAELRLPDEAKFKRLVAKAILFISTQKLFSALSLGDYRAQTVAYTIAYLSYRTAQRIDLDSIWKYQQISEPLSSTLANLLPQILDRIINTAGGDGNAPRNIGEWCKKPACWEEIKRHEFTIPSSLEEELISLSARKDVEKTVEQAEAQEELKNILPSTWFAISGWAKQTDNLHPWQRKMAYDFGQHTSRGRPLTPKQAAQGIKILDEASRLGFKVED